MPALGVAGVKTYLDPAVFRLGSLQRLMVSHMASSSRPAEIKRLNQKDELVLAALRKCGKPVSAYDLIDDLKAHGVKAPPTVYRALGKLIELGLAHKLESLNAFVACAHDHSHTHAEEAVAFAVCEKCGSVEEFESTALSRTLNAWATKHAFSLRKTTLELRGICCSCEAG